MNAQYDYSFTYDEAGNRTRRAILLKSTSGGESIFDESLEKLREDFEPEKSFNDNISEQEIIIYPNPTMGELVIQVKNMKEDVESFVQVFDVAGKEVLYEPDISEYTPVNLSDQRGGVYVLIIKIGDEISRWKVVKE